MKKLVLLLACFCVFALSAACAVDASGKDSSSKDESLGISESQWSDKNVDENGWT